MLSSALCPASRFIPPPSRCSTSPQQPQSPFQQKLLSPNLNLALPQSSRISLLPVFASSEPPSSLGQRDTASSDQQDGQAQALEGADESSSNADSEVDSGDGIEIEVTKIGRNQRRVQARATVAADLETLWGVLTDYEGLADFIPSLAVSQLVEKGDGFARLYQVGQQDLALGLKFNAKGVLDCYEKDLEVFPSGRRRNIEFTMVEGDFQTFKGVWSLIQGTSILGGEDDSSLEGQEGFQTVLSYMVEIEPKLWLPVGLIEGRLCKEVRMNISSVREEAVRIQRNTTTSTLPS